MEYTRQLKKGKSGEDVLYMKKRLVELGYLYAATKRSFGSDTQKAVKEFQKVNGLDVNGVVNQQTWDALFSEVMTECENVKDVSTELSAADTNTQVCNVKPSVEYSRQLKKGKSGEDVLCVKKRLVEFGYLYAATNKNFGSDTYKAVKAFQAANDLEIDGVVGPLTWAALFSGSTSCDPDDEKEQEPVEAVKIPDWYGEEAKVAIGRDLASVSEERRKVCLQALEWAIDPLHPTATLRGFYIRAGKAYGTDLKPNIMTKEKLDSYFKKSSYSQYFDNGRKEMMLAQSEKDGYNKIGCDCSGFVCGIWRITKVVSSGFAACANTLYNSKCVKRSGNPVPGDLAWKSGHIGIYVGGGYVVESAGGAYGIQLTKTSKRQVYNYVKKKLEKMNGWTYYGDPKAYA